MTEVWRRLRKRGAAMASALILAALASVALLSPVFAALLGIDPNAVDLLQRLSPPSAGHLFGTDDIGRDVLLRLIQGGQVSLFVGLAAALASAVIGTLVGLIAGYRGGRFDDALMRLTDGVIALPLLPLLIVLAAIDLTKLGVSPELATAPAMSLYRIVAIIALIGWTTVARLVRGATLSVRTQDFVEAAISQGTPPWRIMLVHILPNVASPIVVATTLSVGNVILLESVLSFLGLGIQPPWPSWGNMLTNAQELITAAPLLAVWPGLLIFTTVIACNILGDGLQDALDPKAEN